MQTHMQSAAAALLALLLAFESVAADKGLVLVAGATGQTGRPLVTLLKEHGYSVRAMARRDIPASELGADEVVKADVTMHHTLPPAVAGADYVISTIGTASGGVPEDVDFKGITALIDAAKAAGAKQFVLISSIVAGNTDPEYSFNKTRGMVFMWKGRADDYLRESGLPYTIVKPGTLVNCEHGKAGLNVAGPGDPIPGGPICRADVALLMIAALDNPDALGKTVFVRGNDTGAPVDAWRADLAGLKKD